MEVNAMLFSEGTIGQIKTKNRIIMTAMGCGLSDANGVITDDFIRYYETRAKGGVGLIITELACVDPIHGRRSTKQIHLSNDLQIPKLRELTDTIHRYGTCIFPQLHHPGVMTTCEINGNEPLISPSGVESRLIKEPSREMSVSEIWNLVSLYADAAKRAKAAGFDGVEIHAAHHYLIHQFLSNYFNKRTDEFGGSFENRTRFLGEIVKAVRKAVGDDYPLSVRISADEFYGEYGYHLDEGIKLAVMLDSLGVNLINVSAGGIDNGKSQSIEPISYKQGWKTYLSDSIKKRVSCKVAGTSVYRDADFAESVLQAGKADYIGIGRALLADPEWPRKQFEKRKEEIRPCISCLYCIDNVKKENHIECSVNPYCGNERNAMLGDNLNGMSVAVIGAGLCGMEAASVFAERGAQVTIYEKASNIGGQVLLASNVPGKERMKGIIDYYSFRLNKLNVNMLLNTEVTNENLPKADLIVNASGAVPVIPGFLGEIKHHTVLTPVDILSGATIPRNSNIVIIGTGMTGLETAEYLIQYDNHITFIEMSDEIAPGANRVNVNDIIQRLNVYDTVFLTHRKLIKLTEDSVVFSSLETNEIFELPADVVVLSIGVKNNNGLADLLSTKGVPYVVLGDAKKSGKIYDAIHSANEFARTYDLRISQNK